MNAIKCSHCGFLGFAVSGCCKSCGYALESPSVNRAQGQLRINGSKRPLRMIVAAFAIPIIVIGVIAAVNLIREKLNQYLDKTPGYAERIIESVKFRTPITVRVNQSEIQSPFAIQPFPAGSEAGKAVKAADILEGLGLLTMSTETTYDTIPFGETVPQPYYANGSLVAQPTQTRSIDIKHARLVIALTEEGRQEALKWTETNDGYQSVNGGNLRSIPMSWWVIPIGERELVRIESVKEFGANEVAITFRWRWKPNKMGENFDCGGDAVSRLPEKARNAVADLAWNSQIEYSAEATLRRSGESWNVSEMYFPNEPRERQ